MFYNTLRLALRSISSNKMRSFLTMLGIIIGCMSVIMLVSIGQSATGSVSRSISSMGTDLVTVNITDSDYALTLEEFLALEDYSPIQMAAPCLSTGTAARREDAYLSVTALGVTPDYLEVTGRSLEAGRNLVPSDDTWRNPVAVVGTRVAETLFESYQVVGETLTMGNRSFLIVGLLEETGSNQKDAQVLIPMSMAERISDSKDITTCYLKAASTEEAEAAQEAAEQYLYSMTGDEEVYDVYNESDLLETLDEVMSTLSLMLGASPPSPWWWGASAL